MANNPAHSRVKRPQGLFSPPVLSRMKPYKKGAGRYPPRFCTKFAKEFAVVLAEGGTEWISLDIKRGTQKPPQKNWNHKRPKEAPILCTKGSGKATIAPKDIIETARGKERWLSKPPSLEKAMPPIATPATGPVIAQIAKSIFVVFGLSPRTVAQ
jgi:hypothetical protein